MQVSSVDSCGLRLSHQDNSLEELFRQPSADPYLAEAILNAKVSFLVEGTRRKQWLPPVLE